VNPQDQAGHQFTFLIYSSEEIAATIDCEIRSMAFLETLQSCRLLRAYFLERGSGSDIHLIEGTSDKSWSPAVQKSWPYYIMGVSEMLLDLADELKQGRTAPQPSEGLTALEGFYGQLNDRIAAVWQQGGSHAFLHHFNALFGYAPIVAMPRGISGVLMTF
jgi:hypothetical protein